ncbi:MAG: AraC family transcriptional regulator ligand-binding domain-containing protein [Terricaulis silvestris]
MIEIVRAETLRGYRAFVTELGGDPDALLAAVQLTPEMLSNADAYISFRAVVHLLERTAQQLDAPDFGLRYALVRPEDTLGPLAVVMQNAASAREAVLYAERFLHFHNPTLEAGIEPAPERQAGPDHELISLEHRMSRPIKMVQVVELALCSAARFISTIANTVPKEVWFRHARCAPLAAYKAHFAAPVLRFSMPRQGFILNRAVLDAPRALADEKLKHIAAQYIESTVPPAETFGARARVMVERMMLSGECTQLDLARAAGLHERTLQRRLQDEGTSFEAIKDDVRRTIARRFLAQANVPLSHIAEVLGYAESSALTRSVKRWFGLSPRALRKQLLEAA